MAERLPVARPRPVTFVTEPSPGGLTVAELSARSGIHLGIGGHHSGLGDFVFTVNGQGADPEIDGWLFGLGQGNRWEWVQGRASATRTRVPAGERVFWALDSAVNGRQPPSVQFQRQFR